MAVSDAGFSVIAWAVATGLVVAIELATGTFYLLMIALGLAAGGLVAWAGAGVASQLIAAAAVGAGATALLRWGRSRRPQPLEARRNRDVNLDIGEAVRVDAWAVDETARVQYRGSSWIAKRASGAMAVIGRHRVVAVEGNWLVLAPVEPGSIDPGTPS